MTSEQIQQTLSEISARITEIDAEELAASDSGTFERIPALRVERDQLGTELHTLNAEFAAAQEAERSEARDELGPRIANEYAEYHSRNVAAVEGLEGAALVLIERDAAQRKYVQWSAETLRGHGEGGPVRYAGSVPAIVGPLGSATRIEPESKRIGTEAARITERVFRALGEVQLADTLKNRVRAGNPL